MRIEDRTRSYAIVAAIPAGYCACSRAAAFVESDNLEATPQSDGLLHGNSFMAQIHAVEKKAQSRIRSRTGVGLPTKMREGAW